MENKAPLVKAVQLHPAGQGGMERRIRLALLWPEYEPMSAHTSNFKDKGVFYGRKIKNNFSRRPK